MSNDQPDYELCGQHLNQLPVHEFYSYGRVMIIELDQITKEKQNVIGFYEFLDRGKPEINVSFLCFRKLFLK
ncbi:unnamed protein product [Schistosoma margrebowiei]|uniref:Uncharacterized protein n=1 Tax=Schistosoma margrebowiei TaxID=48269 RepID=A0A183N3Y6_9TREM|nr:unnamed protein product [Schistosoma margrebowiei]